MAKILCAWEFGSGLGHLTRLLPVARALKQAGHTVVIAVPNPKAAQPIVVKHFPDGANIVSGADWRAPNDPDLRKKPTHIMADVLSLFQYANAERLGPMVHLWRQLIDAHAPDLIVADFAPTLRLASYETRPFVMVGNGYTVPPGGRLLPPMKPWQDVVHPFSRMNEAEIWQVANRARMSLKGPAVDYVSDLLNGDQSFVCTIPEFDPYQPYRQQTPLMPFNVPVMRQSPPVAERGDQAPIFVYLPGNHPYLKIVMAVVSHIGWPVEAFISGMAAEKLAPLAGKNVRFHRNPVNLEENLWRYRMIIHHAGLATAYAAVKAGTPQLVLPVNLEHSITSRGLEKFGGTLVQSVGNEFNDVEEISGQLSKKIKQLLESPDLWEHAHNAALAVAKRPESNGEQIILDHCLAYF